MNVDYNRLSYLILQRMLPYTKFSSESELLSHCCGDYFCNLAYTLHGDFNLLDWRFKARSFPIATLDEIEGSIKPGHSVILYKDDNSIKTELCDWLTRGFQITVSGKWLTKAIPDSTKVDPKIVLGYVLAKAFALKLDDFPFDALGSIYHISYPNPIIIERVLGSDEFMNWRCMKTDFRFSATDYQLYKHPEVIKPNVKESDAEAFDSNHLARQITGSLFEDR